MNFFFLYASRRDRRRAPANLVYLVSNKKIVPFSFIGTSQGLLKSLATLKLKCVGSSKNFLVLRDKTGWRNPANFGRNLPAAELLALDEALNDALGISLSCLEKLYRRQHDGRKKPFTCRPLGLV